MVPGTHACAAQRTARRRDCKELVHDEDRRSALSLGAVETVIIAHMEPTPCRTVKDAAISQDRGQQARKHKNDVPHGTPVIGLVAGNVPPATVTAGSLSGERSGPLRGEASKLPYIQAVALVDLPNLLRASTAA